MQQRRASPAAQDCAPASCRSRCRDRRSTGPGEFLRARRPRPAPRANRRCRAPRRHRSGCPAWCAARLAHASGPPATPFRQPSAIAFASWVSAETSLMMCAPSWAARRITSALRVSIERRARLCLARACRTGNTRRHSSSRSTASEPGRVDSPPMSRMSAPSASSRSACSIAASAARKRPPSEKLSGVTLTMPMISGLSSARPATGGRGSTQALEQRLQGGIGRARQLIGAHQPTADRFAIPLDELGRSEPQIIAACHNERTLPVHVRKRGTGEQFSVRAYVETSRHSMFQCSGLGRADRRRPTLSLDRAGLLQ